VKNVNLITKKTTEMIRYGNIIIFHTLYNILWIKNLFGIEPKTSSFKLDLTPVLNFLLEKIKIFKSHFYTLKFFKIT